MWWRSMFTSALASTINVPNHPSSAAAPPLDATLSEELRVAVSKSYDVTLRTNPSFQE